MAFSVRFSSGARKDLRALHDYIAKNDSIENADYVAREIVRCALTLCDFPNRGAYPPELLLRGRRDYRQIFFKPYRILYRIRANTVFIAVVADGRRDMTPFLARRLPAS
jgi:toxin ParE1/3/4